MEYFFHIAIILCVYGVVALSLNLLAGYTGLISMAHAAFYGIGAYAVAILMTVFGLSFWVAIVMGIVLTALIATMIGWVLSRFKNDYYLLVSFAFMVIVYGALLSWQSLTRGALGLGGIPRPTAFGFVFENNAWFLILCAIVLVAAYVLSKLIVDSSFGRALKAIREDENVLQIFGYRTNRFKLMIFIITACMAAVGGGLYATYVSFIDPSAFTIWTSILFLSIIILGGLSNLKGTLIGTFILVLLPEALRFSGFSADLAAQMHQLMYGGILVFLMLYRPQGLKGEYAL